MQVYEHYSDRVRDKRALLSLIFYAGRSPGDNDREVSCSYVEAIVNELGLTDPDSWKVYENKVWDRDSESWRAPKNAATRYLFTVNQLRYLIDFFEIDLSDIEDYVSRKRKAEFNIKQMSTEAERAFGLTERRPYQRLGFRRRPLDDDGKLL